MPVLYAIILQEGVQMRPIPDHIRKAILSGDRTLLSRAGKKSAMRKKSASSKADPPDQKKLAAGDKD